MSSPLSSLKKTKKTGLGRRVTPFRNATGVEDLLAEVTDRMVIDRMQPVDGARLPSRQQTSRPSSSASSTSGSLGYTVPSDQMLMSSMMKRITELENKLQEEKKKNKESEKKNMVLDEKVYLLKKASANSNSGRERELENRCFELQTQVHEMEEFLSDYGMVWVGGSEQYKALESSNDKFEDGSVWRPDSSLPSEMFRPDFDKLVTNIEELNALAGDGVSKIQHTIDGARLKSQDPVPLTLYANGLMMYSGPFRSFGDPSTRQCVQDLLDGYFPTELQDRFPDGIPFMVTDKRGIFFKDTRKVVFTGAGQVLGGETGPSRLVPSNLHHDYASQTEENVNGLPEESSLPGPTLSVDQFLNHIPSSVVHNGKVIDVRSSLANTFQNDQSKSSGNVTVVETDVIKDMKTRLERNPDDRPMTPREITTLRIKSETGDKTYILKLRFDDLIGDVRSHLKKQRLHCLKDFHIMPTFPSKTYDDDTASLRDCGLVPNATLHLRLK